jgi:hypothetical protein
MARPPSFGRPGIPTLTMIAETAELATPSMAGRGLGGKVKRREN